LLSLNDSPVPVPQSPPPLIEEPIVMPITNTVEKILSHIKVFKKNDNQ
jgi:hypothetical protein